MNAARTFAHGYTNYNTMIIHFYTFAVNTIIPQSSPWFDWDCIYFFKVTDRQNRSDWDLSEKQQSGQDLYYIRLNHIALTWFLRPLTPKQVGPLFSAQYVVFSEPQPRISDFSIISKITTSIVLYTISLLSPLSVLNSIVSTPECSFHLLPPLDWIWHPSNTVTLDFF